MVVVVTAGLLGLPQVRQAATCPPKPITARAATHSLRRADQPTPQTALKDKFGFDVF